MSWEVELPFPEPSSYSITPEVGPIMKIVEIRAPAEARYAQEFPLEIVVRNTGDQLATASVRLYDGDAVKLAEATAYLPPNSETSIPLTGIMDGLGAFTVEAGYFTPGGDFAFTDQRFLDLTTKSFSIEGIQAPIQATDAFVVDVVIPVAIPGIEDLFKAVMGQVVMSNLQVENAKLISIDRSGSKFIIWVESPIIPVVGGALMAALLIVGIVGVVVLGVEWMSVAKQETITKRFADAAQVITNTQELQKKAMDDPSLTPAQKVEAMKSIGGTVDGAYKTLKASADVAGVLSQIPWTWIGIGIAGLGGLYVASQVLGSGRGGPSLGSLKKLLS